MLMSLFFWQDTWYTFVYPGTMYTVIRAWRPRVLVSLCTSHHTSTCHNSNTKGVAGKEPSLCLMFWFHKNRSIQVAFFPGYSIWNFTGFGLQVHRGKPGKKSKTECMYFPPAGVQYEDADTSNVSVDGGFYHFCKRFKYLGSIITPDLKADADVKTWKVKTPGLTSPRTGTCG